MNIKPVKMLDQFWIYAQLGFQHILDVEGYDHMLFLVALCAGYTYRDWKTVLWLVTAFTIGHSITLALAALNIITLSTPLIEWLIPVTIAATALYDTVSINRKETKYKYLLAIGFGLIHGMGFSNFLRSMFGGGGDIILPLLSFNIGLEVGQVLFVAILVALNGLVISLGLKKSQWQLLLSGIALAMGVWMSIERWPF